MLKRTLVMLTALLAPFQVGAVAYAPQALAKPAEPKLIGVIYTISPDGTLQLLVRETAKSRTKSSFTKGTAYAEVPGAKSAFRLKSVENLTFLVKVASGVDPSKFQLLKFEQQKGSRVVVLAERGTLDNSVKRKDPSTVPVDITQEGASNVYRIVISTAIPAGEYGFSASDSNDTFTFGID